MLNEIIKIQVHETLKTMEGINKTTLEQFFWKEAGKHVDQPTDEDQWASSFASELSCMQLPLTRIQCERIDELTLIAAKLYGFKV